MGNVNRILIIDDDEGAARSLELILRRKGYETESALTGTEGLEKAAADFFDVAILDIKLPDTDGTKLLNPLKAINPDIALLVVTAFASIETAVRAMEAGASGYIIKPLNIDEVLAKVRGVLEKQQLIRENRNLLRTVQRELAERKKAEQELREYTTRLEFLNQELEEFAFVASHDLQEPLRKIQTFSQIIADRYHPALDEQGRDYLMRMNRTAKRMSELLRSLLNYSRFAARSNSFQPTDLAKVARYAASDLELLIAKAGGEVEIAELPEIDGDPIQLQQLFQNLIENSLKFIKKGQKPIVKIYCSSSDNVCRIVVEDNGIGFEEQFLDRIFKPFQRLHGKNSEYEGTGMGLAICRKIVERHGGCITATSTPGSGASFLLDFPLSSDGME